MTLQGAMQPAQIISLLEIGGNTIAMGDHADHIHVGWRPLFGPNERLGRQARRLLSNNQWDRFVDRLTDIENPIVRTTPSKYSIRVKRTPRQRSSHAHVGRVAHVRTPGSSSGSASSTSPFRSGRLTAAT